MQIRGNPYIHQRNYLQTSLIKSITQEALTINWAWKRENLSWEVCEQERHIQPAHPHRLISAFVIRFLESIISKPATSNSTFWLAEETCLNR